MKKRPALPVYLLLLAAFPAAWPVSAAFAATPTVSAAVGVEPKGAIPQNPNILRKPNTNAKPRSSAAGGIGQEPAATNTAFSTKPALLYMLSESSGINQILTPTPTPDDEATALLFYDDPTIARNILPYSTVPYAPEPTSADSASPSAADLAAGLTPAPSGRGAELCPRLTAPLSGDAAFWNRDSGRFLPAQPQTTPAVAQTAPIYGGPAQMAAIGPVSNWCQQKAMPFYDSSPLANRVFWVPVLVVAVGVAVLLGTRTRLNSNEREA